MWPDGATLEQKLWGSKEDLETTARFLTSTGLQTSNAEEEVLKPFTNCPFYQMM